MFLRTLLLAALLSTFGMAQVSTPVPGNPTSGHSEENQPQSSVPRGGSERQPPSPEISDFVLYAERSIRMGHRSHTEGGDVGIRSAVAQERRDVSQLHMEEHAKCGTAFSPSISLEDDAEIGKAWTNSLKRVKDTEVGTEGSFPADRMPPLPLASASGGGKDIEVEEHKTRELTPGSYGAIVMEEHSTLRLSEGTYTFASVKMGGDSKILGERGGVEARAAEARATGLKVRIAGSLQMGEEAKIEPAWDDAKARDFVISVAGSDPMKIVDPALAPPTTRMVPTTVVSMDKKSKIHGLLAAPHGTIWMAEDSGGRGAFAAFDIVLAEHVEVEYESGFPTSAAGQQGSQQTHGYFAVQPDVNLAPIAGAVPADTKVALSFGLPVKDPAGLKTFVKEVSDPKSPNYRKHLTQPQFYAKYGASDADYQSLRTWAQNHGFVITGEYPNHLLLAITGTAQQFERALYVNLNYRLRPDGTKFVTPDRDPSLDLNVPILHITGLGDYAPPRHLALNGTGAGRTYRATDLRNAYLGVGSSCQNFDGTGQVIGIVDFATFQNSDISGYFALQSPPLAPKFFPSIVAVEGGNPAANSALEATLDVELAQAMAPNAQILLFQGSSGLTGHLDDILHAMATSNPPLTVVSCSLIFGRSDNSQQAMDEMAAQGLSFFTAAGDFGDVGDPQDNLDMDSQTLVGGTFLNTNTLNATPPIYPNPYYAQPPGETTWNTHVGTTNQSFGVTGGGIMNGSNQAGGNIFNVPAQGCQCWPQTLCCGSGVALPSYQLGVSMATNGGSTQWRNFPDVAMLAIQPELVFQGQVATNVAGTSLAAPLWAGYMALVNQASQKNGAGLGGFLNTTLYDIGLTSGLSTDLYKVCFNDIQDGVSNANGWNSATGFKSVTGYDLTTGWGSPTCGLMQQLSTVTPLTPNQPLDLIRFVISTGGDDLRNNHCCGCGGTGLTADVLLNDGTSFPVTLKPTGTDDKWDNNTTTSPLDFPIPTNVTLTQSQGIAGVKLTIHEDYSTGCGPDNWDMTALNVSLFNPPFNSSTSVCQLALTGSNNLQDGSTGLIRFSENPGGSGVGQTATFLVSSGSGCPH
jgi:hypothetical protein